MDILYRYNWPGNIRELENAIERAVVMCKTNRIDRICLPSSIIDNTLSTTSQKNSFRSLKQIEKRHILKVLEEVGGNQTVCAQVLGINKKTLWEKLKKYNIKPIKKFETK